MATRVRNQRGEGERLRAALLDAATELLGESPDVEAMSVRAVTARAGVSPTALYLHFADKQALVKEVKARGYASLDAELATAEAEHDGDPRAQIEAMGRAYLRFAREQPGRYGILFTAHVGDHRKTRTEFEHDDSDAGAAVFARVKAAVERCGVEAADAFDLSCVLWMALHGLATGRVADRSFPFPAEERYVALLIERAIGPAA